MGTPIYLTLIHLGTAVSTVSARRTYPEILHLDAAIELISTWHSRIEPVPRYGHRRSRFQ
jgi:hypothetical protein